MSFADVPTPHDGALTHRLQTLHVRLQALRQLEGQAALRALRTWIQDLRRSDAAAALAALQQQATDHERQMHARLQAHMHELTALRRELGGLAGGTQPALADPDPDPDNDLARLNEAFTFRHFDRRAQAELDLDAPWLPGKNGRWPALIDELQAVIETKLVQGRKATAQTPALAPSVQAWQQRFTTARTTLAQHWTAFRTQLRQDAGFAWRTLDWLDTQALYDHTPAEAEAEPETLRHAFLCETLQAMWQERPVRWEYCPSAAAVWRDLQHAAARLLHALSAPAAPAAPAADTALDPALRRLTWRLQWYERRRLQRILLTHVGVEADARLSEDIARLSFELGLVAVTTAMQQAALAAEIDLAGQMRLMVDAIHHRDLDADALRQRVQHLHQQLCAWQAAGIEMEHALLVLVRLDGARFTLPQVVPQHGRVLHLAQVDLAPADDDEEAVPAQVIDLEALL